MIDSDLHEHEMSFSGNMSRLRLLCPNCRRHSPTAASSESFHPCSGCGFAIIEKDGIFRGLRPERRLYFDRFTEQYSAVRAKEGRGSSSSDYYLALPFRDLTGNNSWQWQIRARTFQHLQKHVLPEIESCHPKGCDVLDIGAGNCWLSYRLGLRGHRTVAVDLLDNEADGLGAGVHYLRHMKQPFQSFQAEMDCLPFDDAQFDVVIFNASFHYSVDYEVTLAEALRCLRCPGHVIITDSAFYRREESGRAMLGEKRASFKQRFGFESDSIPSREYLTQQTLDQLANRFGIQWRVLRPWYGIDWALRPIKARLARRREPSRFYLFWGQIGQ
ncbi:MAG TPA: class I SAM-dependent methyltransferase [Candidatus Eisenbacteria bacterium]|nr:class I SAM-dependent methyltransferase [Candidatus Eisenbacteria bacterium]